MTEEQKKNIMPACPFMLGANVTHVGCIGKGCALWISKPNPIDSKLDVGTCSFRQIACNMDTVRRKMLNLDHLQRLP